VINNRSGQTTNRLVKQKPKTWHLVTKNLVGVFIYYVILFYETYAI